MAENTEIAVTLAERERALIVAEGAYNAALAALRESCPHDVLLEAGWQSNMWGDLLPLRICETCGTEEEGWRFHTLTGRAYPTSRAEVYRARKRGGRCVASRSEASAGVRS